MYLKIYLFLHNPHSFFSWEIRIASPASHSLVSITWIGISCFDAIRTARLPRAWDGFLQIKYWLFALRR